MRTMQLETDRLTKKFTWMAVMRVGHQGPGTHAAAPTADCMQEQHRQGQSEGQG